MTKCLVCGVDGLEKRGRGQALYCLKCAGVANLRNGAREAYRAIARARANGLLPAAKEFQCVDCGKQALDWDHRDYNKPLDVEPVCRSCNKLRGPAIPLGGAGLFTTKQAKFVAPNWTAYRTTEDVLAVLPPVFAQRIRDGLGEQPTTQEAANV